jgi:hypothetical protein
MACPIDPENPETTMYSVTTETYLRPDETTENKDVGTVKVTPSGGPTGTEVIVTIISADKYYLDEVFQDNASKGAGTVFKFTLSDKDVTVKAYFKALSLNTYKVILAQPEGGTISFTIDGAYKEYGSADATVILSYTANDGYGFKEYTVDGEATTNPTFTLPKKHVTVSGVFEKLADKSIDELIGTGKAALESGNFAAAINAYETAYSKNPDNAEALVYSTIGKLASVAWSSQVGNFFKNRLGLKSYPSTLDALLSPQSWFEYYPDKDRADYYYDSGLGEYLSWESKDRYTWDGGAEYFDKYYTKGDGYYYRGPYKFVSGERKDDDGYGGNGYYDDNGNWIRWVDRENSPWYSDAEFKKWYPNGDGYYYQDNTYIYAGNVPHYNYSSQVPLNVPGWVTEKGAYKDTLVTIGETAVASSSTWPIILIANLVDRNATGLNPALDDAIAAIFDNPSYKAAEERTAKLKETKTSVKLDAEIIEKFGLSEFFGDADVYIGWAELELLFSALNLVKGTLLYVNSYKWDYDIGFVKDLPWDKSALEQIDTIAGNRNKVLPLRTGFMTDRGGNYLANSKTAYVTALTSIIGVYDYYTGDDSKLPTGYKETLNEFQWAKDAAGKVKDAIEKGETFHVQKSMPSSTTYDNTGTNALFSINFDKFFTPGQLALEKLIETEGSGNTKSPVFYGSTRNTDGTLGSLTEIGSSEDLGKYDGIALKFKIDPIGDIVGAEFARNLARGFAEFSGEDPVIVFDPMVASIAWAAYHWEDGGKEIIDQFLPKSGE